MAKATVEIRSLARSHSDTAIRTLAAIMTKEDAPESARVAAANAILDRGWGKPQQTVDMTVRKQIAKELSDDELADIATGSSERTASETVGASQLN